MTMRLTGGRGLQEKAAAAEMAQGVLLFLVSSSLRGSVKGSPTLGMNGPGCKSISPSLVIDL